MDFKSKLLNDAVEQMSSLPGIGKRSALRLVLHLLDQSEKEVKDFTQAFLSLKEHLNFCSKCFHITEQKMCEICRNPSNLCCSGHQRSSCNRKYPTILWQIPRSWRRNFPNGWNRSK